MNTEYVPYKIAKQLKDIGFDEPCNCCYDGSSMLSSYIDTIFEKKNYNTGGSKNTSAPTFYQVFTWFREVHGLYSCIAWVSKGYDFYVKKEHGKIINVSDVHKEYRNAEIACIDYMIKHIQK